VPFERFSALLRAPELQASRAEASAAARLDTMLRSRAPSEATLREWLSLAERHCPRQALEPPAALARLGGALRVLEGLQGHHRMSRWLSIWIDAFEAGPWSLRARWSSAEFQSAVRFRELLETLALGDRTFEHLSRRAAESILERAARDTPFQIQTGVPPIWVSSQLSDPWLAYDGIWVTGCDESRWPPPVDPIALIPPVLQRQHGVIAASAEAQLAFAADLQSRWVARAQACVFSCSDPGEGRHVPASPLLAELAERAPPPPPIACAGGAPCRPRRIRCLRRLFGWRSRSRHPRSRSWSTSALRRWGRRSERTGSRRSGLNRNVRFAASPRRGSTRSPSSSPYPASTSGSADRFCTTRCKEFSPRCAILGVFRISSRGPRRVRRESPTMSAAR
jgi:hypothetical protein